MIEINPESFFDSQAQAIALTTDRGKTTKTHAAETYGGGRIGLAASSSRASLTTTGADHLVCMCLVPARCVAAELADNWLSYRFPITATIAIVHNPTVKTLKSIQVTHKFLTGSGQECSHI
ncbi:uncharacterized protein ColSpa_08036 [Colletotrichum spaethianum]|uniref:Uncharacterized protein n=1 Tax=Colletotrichum spaethianum TaxID=700344 RepID=A0AA37P8Z2_9PEZI|nr:uncharacterized protein ColSpa_08036 [Colletotrichum spaethianum]GKT47855.1 hypothetical protein ColSpa_08036 [Colletotrichum spaethianum]